MGDLAPGGIIALRRPRQFGAYLGSPGLPGAARVVYSLENREFKG